MRRVSSRFIPILASLLFVCIIYNLSTSNQGYLAEPLNEKTPRKPATRPFQGASTAQRYQARVRKCPNYADYASVPHYRDEVSATPLDLPFQRPPENCRTFTSELVEKFIRQFTSRFRDRDLARLFENSFPNTLDTTILWHVSGSSNRKLRNHKEKSALFRNEFPETFVVTGDIHAEWLRDSAWQLSVYQPFIKYDGKLAELIRGAINTQAQLVINNPFCNAFHPPSYCPVKRGKSSIDNVDPKPNWSQVFECKYEVDSLASFLTLSHQYYENAPQELKFSFVTPDWISAVEKLMIVVSVESDSTFDEDGFVNTFPYVFRRNTNVASETLPLAGTGNPVNSGIGLVRSAFRPSDDSTIFQYFIPGNAHLSVELETLAEYLRDYLKQTTSSPSELERVKELISAAAVTSSRIRDGIMDHAIVKHPKFGKVFAYEIDGFGSSLLMDDANIPSLLSLPDLGFLDVDDEIYQNTRRMITCKEGNPYYIKGTHFEGIGGPHIGIHNAWPMSLLVAIRTSENDKEIERLLDMVLQSTGGLGLIHESVQAFKEGGSTYTRPWFAWANSEFAKTILQLAQTKPYLIFRDEYAAEGFTLQNFLLSLPQQAGSD